MKIDPSIAPIGFNTTWDSNQTLQSENREIIQAVRAINASANLGDSNELTFSLDRHSRRPVIKIVNRKTNEVVRQIPNEDVLRMAECFKTAEDRR